MAKYYVTDPCYLFDTNSDEGNKIWDEFCKYIDSDYSKALEILSKGIKSDFIEFESTGYGDWSNSLIGHNVLKYDFCADSGLVCVVKSTPEIEEYIDNTYFKDNTLIAEFETDGDISVFFDVSDPNWTVVNITDTLGNSWKTSDRDDDWDEEDDDDEDYWEDEDEDR